MNEQRGLLRWIFGGILAIGFLILIARLVEVQIIKGVYYLDLAEGNRIRRVSLTPARGEIHARGGEILVGNIEEKSAIVFNPLEGFTKADKAGGTPHYEMTEWQREYKLGSAFAHVSGYLGQVNDSELGMVNPDCPDKGVYRSGILVGRSGLEQQFECKLSGVFGEILFEVDSSGSLVRTLGEKPPKKGEDIITNIDANLQQKVASVMDGVRGAVIVTDINGEIMALYSSPSFDPNLFVKNSPEISNLFKDEQKPFFNRAIGGLFHPGSVFKPVVAIAALESGVISKNYTYEDTGQVVVKTAQGDFSYSNWFFTQYGGQEGRIDLSRALARSTDTFFYKVGELMGPSAMVSWAQKFGLDAKTGIDLPGEVPGLIPSPEWKRRVKGENWFLGNTYHMSIGQGDVALTPLAVNMGTIAALTGKLCSPKIVGETSCHDLGIKKENLEYVKEGMVAACSKGGTASIFVDFIPQVACKTGTAETGVNDKIHAWFTVIAPAHKDTTVSDESNQVVVTVLVEEGGEGSQVAAPIAHEILKYWFER